MLDELNSEIGSGMWHTHAIFDLDARVKALEAKSSASTPTSSTAANKLAYGPKGSIMDKIRKIFGAALLALAIVPVAVLVIHLAHLSPATLIASGLALAGTVSFTYESFQHSGNFGGGFTGGATAPTAAQAGQITAMSAQVSFTDTDTTWTFTHNWGLSAAQAAALLPQVIMNIVSGQQALGVAVAPIIAVNVTSNTNAVVFTKVQATGSGCTMSIWLRRAWSASL